MTNLFALTLFQITLTFNKVLAATCVGGVTTGNNCYELPNPLGITEIAALINQVAYDLAVYIAPPILTIMIIIGAFYILTGGDNPEKVKTGKQIILWSVIGYAIILIAGGVSFIIKELLGA